MSSVKDLVRQACSSRIKHAYNALIEIRKKHTKSTGVQSLVNAGLVRRLVELVRTRDSLPDSYRVKVVDISLSILANLCMEEVARAQLLKTDGVTELGELFLGSDCKTLLHRSCRCLANILLSPRSWEPVHSLAILEKLGELLRDTEDDDCKQSYIRTVRLLGQTPRYVGLLVENNLVCDAAKHLDAENSDVKKAAFRCVQSLSTHGCTAQFARQIVKSGKVGFLLGLLPEQNTDVFPLLCKLAEHEEFRPQFGNDLGIANFIQFFRSPDEPFCSMRIEILNVLCLCCQESVNRMKLRENDALSIFLESLTDEKFAVLHERIVSAFVCFMYDEQGFEMLLDGGMVEIVRKMFIEYMKKSSEDTDQICKSNRLAGASQPMTEISEVKEEPKHVNRDSEMIEAVTEIEEHKMDITESNCASNLESAELSLPCKNAKESTVKEPVRDDQESEVEKLEATNKEKESNQGTTTNDTSNDIGTASDDTNSHLGTTANDTANDKGTTRDDTDVIGDNISLVESEDIVSRYVLHSGIQCSGSQTTINIEDQEHQDTPAPIKEQRQRPKYSMDSPTYESVAKELREMNTAGDHHGPTCIESFTPPHTMDPPRSPYSPLSTSSYFSPSGSSPDMSSGYSSDHDHHVGHSPRCTSRQKRVLFSLDSSPEDGGPSRQQHKYTGLTWSPDSSPDRGSSSGIEEKAVWSSPERGSTSCTEETAVWSSPNRSSTSGTEEGKAGLKTGLKSSSCPEFTCKEGGVGPRSSSSDTLGLNVESGCMFEDEESLYSPVVSTLEFEKEYASQVKKMVEGGSLPLSPTTVYAEKESRNKSESLQGKSVPLRTANDVKLEIDKGPNLSQSESLSLSQSVDVKLEHPKPSQRENLPASQIVDGIQARGNIVPINSLTNPELPSTTNKLVKLDLGKASEMSMKEETTVTDKNKLKSRKGKGKKRKRSTPQNKRFEMNVLQLFSRVQDLNPLLYIVTSDMVTCLLDYLCTMDSPLTRVAKILSRAFRDRLCFEKILKLNIPAMLFEKLLPEHCLPGVISELAVRTKYSTRMPHWPEIFEFVQPNSLVTERFSLSVGSPEAEYHPTKRSRYADSEKGCAEPWKSEVVHNSDICSIQKCRVALLEDLRTVVDTQFGCGGIERIVLTNHAGLSRELAACLPLLSWSKETRKFYFKHLNITDQLLKELESGPSELLTRIVLGFGFLARTSDMGTKYREPFTNSSSSSFVRLCNKPSPNLTKLDMGDPSESKCKVDDYIPAADEQLAVFLTDSGKVTASKTVLTEQSEFFAAMLKGNYKESTLAEIPLPETSAFALSYLIHHTYGCGNNCPVITHLRTVNVSRESLKCCTDLLGEADKHLLSELHESLVKNVIGRFIVPECALPLFEYAVVRDNVELQKAAVGSLLADGDLAEIRGLFCEFLGSQYSQVFLQTLYEMLTDW